jgi:hypothetical protein
MSMRLGVVGLVDVKKPDRTTVTQLELEAGFAEAEDSRLFTNSKSAGKDTQPANMSGAFSSLRSTLTAWVPGQLRSATAVRYVAIPEDPEDVEDGADYDGAPVARPELKSRRWTWRSALLGLALL